MEKFPFRIFSVLLCFPARRQLMMEVSKIFVTSAQLTRRKDFNFPRGKTVLCTFVWCLRTTFRSYKRINQNQRKVECVAHVRRNSYSASPVASQRSQCSNSSSKLFGKSCRTHWCTSDRTTSQRNNQRDEIVGVLQTQWTPTVFECDCQICSPSPFYLSSSICNSSHAVTVTVFFSFGKIDTGVDQRTQSCRSFVEGRENVGGLYFNVR